MSATDTATISRRRVTHELKTWPEFFNATRNGEKKFELRRNDRDFKVGDQLFLKEWNPEVTQSCNVQGYTGRELLVRVDYIMPVETVDQLMDLEIPYPAEHVIMSVSHVN